MTTSPPTNEPPAEETRPKWPGAIALGWGLACAACAGGTWFAGFHLAEYRLPLPYAEIAVRHRTPLVIAFAGGIGGLLGGLLVALRYSAADMAPRILVWGGTVAGTLGGALTLHTVVLVRECLTPLVSSTLLWCVVGFLVGLMAHRYSAAPARTESDTFRWQHLREWLVVRLLPFLAVTVFLFLPLLTVMTTRYLD